MLLAFAVARRWPAMLSNALEPDWVPTRMGGPSAPGDMVQAHLTQAWLAVGNDEAARVTGGYLYHRKPRRVAAVAQDVGLQDRLIDIFQSASGLPLS